MRITILLLFLCAVTCSATTLLDPFNVCYTGSTVCGGDVIGNPLNYDIQMATMTVAADSGHTGDTVTVSLYFDSGAVTGSGSGMSLGSFSDAGLSLIVGDLFFYSGDQVGDPSDPTGTLYAVPLDTVGRTFTAGALYQVTTDETASQALGNPTGVTYRPAETVLMTAGTLEHTTGNSPVTVAKTGDNGTTTGPLYEVTVSFDTTSTSFMSLVKGGQIGILFSSADCANDVIEGTVPVTTTPEPQSLALIAGGLGMLIGVSAWRRRTTRKSRAA